MRLNVVTVETGNYLGRGREYIRKCLGSFRRHMPATVEARYWVITDSPLSLPDYVWPLRVDPGTPGWWGILQCFKPEQFPAGERMLYTDLDQLAVGDLGDIAHYLGPFAALRDVFYPERIGDGVMLWNAGDHSNIWTEWVNAGRPMVDGFVDGHVGGSQWWIEQIVGTPNIVRLQDRFPGQLCSYKAKAMALGALPDNTRILFFHGRPRPHEVADPWFQELWRKGEGAAG